MWYQDIIYLISGYFDTVHIFKNTPVNVIANITNVKSRNCLSHLVKFKQEININKIINSVFTESHVCRYRRCVFLKKKLKDKHIFID